MKAFLLPRFLAPRKVTIQILPLILLAVASSCGSAEEADRKAMEEEQKARAEQKNSKENGKKTNTAPMPPNSQSFDAEGQDLFSDGGIPKGAGAALALAPQGAECTTFLEEGSELLANKVTDVLTATVDADCADGRIPVIYIKTEPKILILAALQCEPFQGGYLACKSTQTSLYSEGRVSIPFQRAVAQGEGTGRQLAFVSFFDR
jgi:antirestriction protein